MKVVEIVVYCRKTPKNTKKITEKYVEDERGLGRGGKDKGGEEEGA
jgi:hypothetical protein